jgi:flagellar biosynthesis/type III secretory pathway protein FliH
MAHMLRIHLAHPVAAVHLIGPPGVRPAADGGDVLSSHGDESPLRAPEQDSLARQELAQLRTLMDGLVNKLGKLYEETILQNRSDIARLAVEIARKVLQCEISRGDYNIEAVVEEALKRAPTHQDIVVRVNPEDLPQCRQLGQDSPDGSAAGLTFVPDWSVARADCIVETPKGIVKSFVEQHLERIGEALMRME